MFNAPPLPLLILLGTLASQAGCGVWIADADFDGIASADDCDDHDPTVGAGLPEICDGLDNDCDGLVDDNDPDLDASGALTAYPDEDADGYGDEQQPTILCELDDQHVATGGDCDDTDADINPNGVEVCDGADNDCDGTTDEDDATDALTWYADTDGDGYGDPSATQAACQQPDGYVDNADDCDDTTDLANPSAGEVCDGLDNDCDGLVDGDDDSVDLSSSPTWYLDEDADGYGSTAATLSSCEQPSGYAAESTDCDDGNAAINPAADELCDGLDNDCDTLIDEEDATDAPTWYLDADGDSYGDPASTTFACQMPGGYAAEGTDCADNDASRNPSATEVCDELDNDCDGLVDDEDDSLDTSSANPWYADADSDGWGDSSGELWACDMPSGYLADHSDCDDGDASINPSGTEICDGLDNDCDGTTDESDASDASTWYLDADGDGYGVDDDTTVACDQPNGYAAEPTDCDDADAAISPGAPEICDEIDNDCDDLVDDDDTALDPSGSLAWYTDADADGYGLPGSATYACSQPSGLVDSDTDCDDSDDTIHPAALERTNDGIDNDCDGTVDLLDSSATWARWTGETAGDGAGTAVAGAGDMNNDGTMDLLIGAPTGADGSIWPGVAYLIYGPTSGQHDLGGADLILVGAADGDLLGCSLAPASDLDGDGVGEVWVGASGQDGAATDAGAVYLFSSDLVIANPASATATLYGESANDAAGSSIAAAGDVDGDGYDDLLVGSPNESSVERAVGAVYLVWGPVSGTWSLGDAARIFYGDQRGDTAGSAVAGGSDLDGDGLTDVLASAPEEASGGRNAGAIYVLLGPTTGATSLDQGDYILYGVDASDTAGTALATGGDVDGDGYDDFLVGAPGEDTGGTGAGAAYLLRGGNLASGDLSLATALLAGEGPSDAAGSSVALVPDFNGDSYDDILVGVPQEGAASTLRGAAYLVSGPVSGTFDLANADVKLTGQSTNDDLGAAVAGLGDIDADGYGDLLVGAPADDSAGTDAGLGVLLLGEAF